MTRCLICGQEGCRGVLPPPQHIITMEVSTMAAYVADRRLYLDKDGKVVEDDDPAKVSLLVGAGGTLPEEQARALGLLDEKAKSEPSENKARKAAPENKAK